MEGVRKIEIYEFNSVHSPANEETTRLDYTVEYKNHLHRYKRKDRRLRIKSKPTVFCFVSERAPNGKAAAKETGVRLSTVWWSVRNQV